MSGNLRRAYALLADVIERPAPAPLTELQIAEMRAAERVVNEDAGAGGDGIEAQIFFSFIKARGLQDDFLSFRERAMEKAL